MSVCYDFQKWAIVSLASIVVAISLTIGLMDACGQYINGRTENGTGVVKNVTEIYTNSTG